MSLLNSYLKRNEFSSNLKQKIYDEIYYQQIQTSDNFEQMKMEKQLIENLSDDTFEELYKSKYL